MDHLKQYQVGEYPVHYIPNFIFEDEETTLLRKIESSPSGKWRNLPNRRLQVWGGDIAKSGTLIPQDLPPFVATFPNLLDKLRSTGAFASTAQGTVNHIILNEYLPGQGITPHQDGPAYYPAVATLSLASHTVMEYYQYQEQDLKTRQIGTQAQAGKIIDPTPILRLLLEPRSLVITHGHLYTTHLHGISGAHYDIFVSSARDDSHAPAEKYKRPGYETQVVPAHEISNRALLGSERLRNQFERLVGLEELSNRGEGSEGMLCLERQTRTSLTCRVVEKTSTAAGKLLKLR